MKLGAAFGFALVGATVTSMFICMFPLTRALSKIGGLDIGWFMLHEVSPRVIIAAVLVSVALVLHLRGTRWSWAMLVAAPPLSFAGDLFLMALPG
ncbi:hypothetical protein E5A73_12050 [Sphingomonas gei]|uniref:Uncharacterized protein n=1 Tax=Sphingomonas gei TaxID=1395960 RepID=A0A4S1XCJ7_9SPHN|nr:hypothetical protein [Sphingomonas gei]TGX53555.1 hypothetical protein E5A73_12050 [Sphingomonas gei]